MNKWALLATSLLFLTGCNADGANPNAANSLESIVLDLSRQILAAIVL